MNEELDYSKLNGTNCYNAQGEDGKDAFEHTCEQINKLQNNWNELKKWLEDTRKYETWCEMAEAYDIVINKMQELDGNNGN